MNYRKALLCSAVAAALASLYGCVPDPMPFDPVKMQHNSRQVAPENPTAPMRPIQKQLENTYAPRKPGQPAPQPTTVPTTGPALSEDPIIRMSLREVVHRAVNNNMDVRVAGYEPAIDSNRVVEAESRFDATVFVSPFYQDLNQAASPTSTTLQPARQTTYGASAGVRQDIETGASYELRYETTWYDNFSQFANATDRFYSNNLVGEFKQPLLRNFGVDINRARITVARNDQRISLLDYRKKLEEILFDTERTYWDLYEAEREVVIAEGLVKATEETAELLAKRGTQDVTRVHTSQANSALQQRRAVLIAARSRVRDLSDQLKRLMEDPELPVASNVLILPATEPPATAVTFDPQDQINQALEHRLELAQQVLRIDSSSEITRVAKNNLLPALQAVTTLTSNGAATDWDVATSNAAEFNNVTSRFALQFEMPIGNRQARAIYQRTLLQRQQAIDSYRALIDQAALDVRSALRSVETNWDSRNANHQAVLATADTLDAIVTRERGEEALTPSFVQLKLDTQQRLAEAQRAEAQATANYAVSIAALERAKGTLLRYDNVIMEEDRLDAITRGKVLSNPPAVLPIATQPPGSSSNR